MARYSVSATRTAGGVTKATGASDVLNSVATTTVAADVATLVTDGGSPTQAHVTTLNTDWGVLLAGIGTIPAVKDLVVSFDATKWTMSTLHEALRAVEKQIEAGVGGLNP